jgi:hypothetical protein
MAQGVILGEGRPRLQILVPRGFEDKPVGRCMACAPARARDGLGPLTFYAGQEEQWQAHVAACATRNLDDLRALAPSERAKGTIFAEDQQDRELEAHYAAVRERMRREGRTEVRPNELGGVN